MANVPLVLNGHRSFWFCGLLFLHLLAGNATFGAKGSPLREYLSWTQIAELPPASGQMEKLGVAGPFAGVHQDALIVAGGANFAQPVWNNAKVWHDNIWVLTRAGGQFTWHDGGRLPHPLAYGASVSTARGVLCLGGNDASRHYDTAFLLRWNPTSRQVEQENLPNLPEPCSYLAATALGRSVYVAGGMSTLDPSSAMTNFWRLDLNETSPQWIQLPPWPGPSRAFNLLIAQHNGVEDQVYLFSGRRVGADGKAEFLKDAYAFSPSTFAKTPAVSPWRRIADSPTSVMAGAALSIGQSHIFIVAGDDGALFDQTDALKDQHPGFPKQAWAYHTLTNTWFATGPVPQNQVTTQTVKWNEDLVLVSGEIRPRTRTPAIWTIRPLPSATTFGWQDYAAIGVYLLALVGIGAFFAFRNRSTDDFFRGGQRIPWWAAGCSIFATMLSSLTFMSVPAKVYATDWIYFPINLAIIALAPFIIACVLPFFRSINATSAYEYLELRFNVVARLLASAFYIIFQIGRMAIVMFLPALALATVSPISVETCILLMGLLSLAYCTVGGVEAVIWTDTLQTFVLLGGALLSLSLIILNLNGGAGYILQTGIADHKFHLINWDWSAGSFTSTALWVIVLGGLAQQFVPYASDQGIVQRYMSVSSQKKAAQSIWTNAALSLVASLLFFGLGTALYAFYKQFPQQIDPSLPTDSVFPQFIAAQLPAGVAGFVIAGVFAAGQSTVSTSMNSIASAFTTDFVRRFGLLHSEKAYFRCAQATTLVAGMLGTGFALFLASSDVKSLWDTFMQLIGLLGGPVGGLFLLGMFTRKAHGVGAVLGMVCGALAVAYVQRATSVSVVLHTAVGLLGCVAGGYLFSLIIPAQRKSHEGLTFHSLPKGNT